MRTVLALAAECGLCYAEIEAGEPCWIARTPDPLILCERCGKP